MHLRHKILRAKVSRVFSWGLLSLCIFLCYSGYRNLHVDGERNTIIAIEDDFYPVMRRIDPIRTEYDEIDATIADLENELSRWESVWAGIPAGTNIGRRRLGSDDVVYTGEARDIQNEMGRLKTKLNATQVHMLKRRVVRKRLPHVPSWSPEAEILERSIQLSQMIGRFSSDHGVSHEDYRVGQAAGNWIAFGFLSILIAICVVFGELEKWGLPKEHVRRIQQRRKNRNRKR